MNLNAYIWNLYKNSSDGKQAISVFGNLLNELKQKNLQPLLSAKTFEFDDKNCKLIANWAESFKSAYAKNRITNLEEASLLFKEIAENGFRNRFRTRFYVLKTKDLIDMLASLSTGLYSLCPEYFFPYFFDRNFDFFEKICEAFEIPLPDIPPKNEFEKRLFYYFELCQALYEFRMASQLTPPELGAFLYSFAPNFIKQEMGDELPHPTQIWITGGGINQNGDIEYLDKINESTTSSWHGNINTRRGDIVIMYCLAPRSCIHSIWRAITDGFNDPFFLYKSSIRIGNPIKTIPITYQELKNDIVMSQNGLVKRSMLGVNGVSIKVAEYEAILNMLAQKGQNISLFPKIEMVYQLSGFEEIKNEKDVEKYLVEPLLVKLAYKESDWTRQMVLRMGRGERYYPDYAFFAQKDRGREQAKMILETKYRIATEKECRNAYDQARSYALRLQTKVFILASLEGLWIFSLEKAKFEFENCRKISWDKLEHPDTFNDLVRIIGKTTVERFK